jgi:mRNA-degrading endonuclease toxin of MazEF toxin-antitoxin module
MRRGEVRWSVFKAPDKKRPVLILTRDSILDVLGEVTAAPITSTIRLMPPSTSTATPPLGDRRLYARALDEHFGNGSADEPSDPHLVL